MAKSVLLIVNPISGDMNKDTIVKAIHQEIQSGNLIVTSYYTNGTDDDEKIVRLLSENQFDRVLAVGGDGTIAMVAQHLLNKEIPLGIIPAGSANGLAVNFGIPDNLSEQINIALSDTTLAIDTLTINEKFGLHISDLGVNAELIKNYEDGSFRGKFGYFIQSIPTLINSDYPFDFEILANNKQYEETGALLAIANANKFGTGATINPIGKINDGKFEILIFKKLDILEIAKTIGENPELSSDFIKIIQTSEATISTESPVPFQIDGEYLGKQKEVTVKINPNSLLMALPDNFIKQCTS